MGRETVFVGLFTFGLIYNWIVGQAHTMGYDEGFVSLLVAIGCGVTIAGVALVDPDAAVLCLLAFASSGAPMIAGSIGRYVMRRAHGQHNIREDT